MRWNPGQYARFGSDRLQPALDLIARIDLDAPGVVHDLGCGTGHITRILADRWPSAAVTGLDSSPEMLQRAADPGPASDPPPSPIAWVEGDIADPVPGPAPDLLFSNAAIHWLDDHETLFPALARRVASGGIFAVQMPHNHRAPSHTAMAEAANDGPWAKAVTAVLRPSPVNDPGFYYDVLAPHVAQIALWETEYLHILEGDDPVVEWTRGTSLRPLIAAAGEHAESFLAAYTARIRRAYPKRSDGKTLFPFRRLFFIARC